MKERLAVVLLALVAPAALAACEGRPRSEPAEEGDTTAATSSDAEVAEIDLSRGAPEASPPSLFGDGKRRSHIDLVKTLTTLEDAGETKGLFVRFGGASFGLARAQEAGELLGKFRKKKIPVVCHADDYNNASFLLASKGCSKLWVSPAGGVDTVGIAAQLVFGKSLLEKLHVSVNFLQVGKYKGAEEPFTRDGPSPEARESLLGTLRGLRAAWVDDIVTGRENPKLTESIEDGPFGPDEAKSRGLVDAVGYIEEAKDDVKKLASADRIVTRFGGHASPVAGKGLSGIFRSISGSSQGGSPHIAVVTAVGAISMSSSRSPFGGSDGITEQRLGKTLTKLAANASTKAVVIRIDSPGGSALASDLLWKKLMKIREKKPLVFSVGGMAASGGYYLASAANKIVAEPSSIVGSIGVVSGKLAFGTALEEIGVHVETIPASPDPEKGARAAYLSPFSAWDEPTKKRVLSSMTSIYELFLKRVAEGRKMTVEEVQASAEGRIFDGMTAKGRKLVDEIGGYTEAVALAKKLAEVPDDTPVDVLGETPSFFDFLDPDDDGDEARAAQARPLAQLALAELAPDIAPFPELVGFVGTLAPLVQGERTLTTLPFGLVVR